MLGNKRGQSTMEYGLLIAVVVIALLATNFYMRRGIQGRVRESTDQIGRQFDPTDYETSWKTNSTGTTTTKESRSGETVTTNTTVGEEISRSEYEEFGNTIPASHY